jgi:hypothetical protein
MSGADGVEIFVEIERPGEGDEQLGGIAGIAEAIEGGVGGGQIAVVDGGAEGSSPRAR